MKTIKICGPIQECILQKLITSALNLEHLTVTRRANYPKILNQRDTPELVNLTRLKYLRLNSEEHDLMFSLHKNVPFEGLKPLPLMDCYFPVLKHFEILKRFPNCNSTAIVTVILKFVSRHSKTLKTLELDLIPLSPIPYQVSDSETDESMDEDGHENENRVARARVAADLNITVINLETLCQLQLEKCCITTKGSNRDALIWKSVLENQSVLKELRFDWLCHDPRVEVMARVTGFPWIFFRSPISKCAETLVTVELASLSMMAKDNLTSSPSGPGPNNLIRILPFDLRIFRSCSKLKTLILRCRENHGRVDPEEEEPDGDEDFPQGEPQEVLLMINGSDLPQSIETLEILSFPMLTSDIRAIVQKCKLLRKLCLKECGKTGNFGVSAGVIKEMARLDQLKFLEVIGFNDSTVESRHELEVVFQVLGLPYEGQETWLEFDSGNSFAHHALKQLNEPVFI